MNCHKSLKLILMECLILNKEIPNTGRFERSPLPHLKHKRQKRTVLDLFDKASLYQYAKQNYRR
jgi:hypothetical protein